MKKVISLLFLFSCAGAAFGAAGAAGFPVLAAGEAKKLTPKDTRARDVSVLISMTMGLLALVSAVIFLVTAENELATTYIVGRVGLGDYGVALAYCTVLIILMSLIIALIQFLVGERKLGRRKATAAFLPATGA